MFVKVVVIMSFKFAATEAVFSEKVIVYMPIKGELLLSNVRAFAVLVRLLVVAATENID